jgi:hypothetical protein
MVSWPSCTSRVRSGILGRPGGFEFVDPDTTSVVWADNKHPLEMYQHWLGLR